MVLTGLDRVRAAPAIVQAFLKPGWKAGLLANPTSCTANFEPASLVLQAACAAGGATLVRLFAPEHGFYGEAQAGIEVRDSVDPYTALPVHSLYGTTKTVDPDTLADLDVLFYDVQDVGLRWYTYLGSLVRVCKVLAALRDSGRNFPRLLILDRPNPLGGLVVEGGGLKAAFESLVGPLDIPVRYGLTIGEIGQLLGQQFNVSVQVIQMSGWRRGMLMQDCGLPWIPPSPNLPTAESVLAYSACCLLEGTNVSEGRGTTKPFEIFGAPWIDPFKLKAALDSLGMAGLKTRPVYFVPAFSKHQGERCGGVHVYFNSRQAGGEGLVGLGYRVLYMLKSLYPADFKVLPPAKIGGRYFLSLLSGDDSFLSVLQDQYGLEDYLAGLHGQAGLFEARRKDWLLYEA